MTIIRYIISVLQAFLGVQSTENRDRDFETGNPVIFFIVAIIATMLFLLGLFGFVNIILLDK
jgi:hypothetical protein